MPAPADSRRRDPGRVRPGRRAPLSIWPGLVCIAVVIAAPPLRVAAAPSAGPANGPLDATEMATTFEAMVERLRRMAAALRQVEYEGTLVYLHDRQLNSLRIAHRIHGGESRESVLALSGPIRALSRTQRGVTCVLPDARAIQVQRSDGSGSLQRGVPADPARLQPHYLLHPLGQSRVAGRTTDVIGIIPRDDFRYGYRFHVDRETSLPLKTELMDTAAQPIEQVMFTDLRLFGAAAAPDPAATTGRTEAETSGSPNASAATSPPVALAEAPATVSDWVFSGLPPGFEVVARSLEPSSDPAAAAQAESTQPESGRSRSTGLAAGAQEHLLLSDGLASVSVYIEPAASPGLDGETRMGAVHAAGRRLKGHRITVVGEVPAVTVAAILAGIKPRR
jgi:sigma-E factor negative regulatory protein RseB